MTILLFGPLNDRITFLISQKSYLTIQESCTDVPGILKGSSKLTKTWKAPKIISQNLTKNRVTVSFKLIKSLVKLSTKCRRKTSFITLIGSCNIYI